MSDRQTEPATCNWCRESTKQHLSFGGILFCSVDCRDDWLAAIAEDSNE